MSILYRSPRVGKNGRVFNMLKFRTMKEGSDQMTSFANKDVYTKYGRFLRKYKIDEWPQIINVFRGEMSLVGPRPEEQKTVNLVPRHLRDILLSVKPGMTSLSSLHFFREEKMLQLSQDLHKDYWEKIKPIKIVLDIFYIENKSFSLNLWILWATFKKLLICKE